MGGIRTPIASTSGCLGFSVVRSITTCVYQFRHPGINWCSLKESNPILSITSALHRHLCLGSIFDINLAESTVLETDAITNATRLAVGPNTLVGLLSIIGAYEGNLTLRARIDSPISPTGGLIGINFNRIDFCFIYIKVFLLL